MEVANAHLELDVSNVDFSKLKLIVLRAKFNVVKKGSF